MVDSDMEHPSSSANLPFSSMVGRRYVRSNKLLVTTDTLLKAIINPANSGGIRKSVNGYNTPAAKGKAKMLYPVAHKKFNIMRLNTKRDKCMATTTSLSDERINTTSAASIATCVPAPIAIPMSM